MKSVRLYQFGGPEAVQLEPLPSPVAAAGEVVVEVAAAGVNALDWKIRDGLLAQARPMPWPIALGAELAGTVRAVGAGVDGWRPGQRVFGALPGLGAYAEEVAVAADLLAEVPAGLDWFRAAALPVAALTAWQALHEAGELRAGQRVLILGAAGGVGGFAVQFASQSGATVIASAGADDLAYVEALGASRALDYRSSHAWEQFEPVDLVLDLVGGAALAQAWGRLAPTGRVVSTAAVDIAAQAPPGRDSRWFAMHPQPARLAWIGNEVVAGRLQVELANRFTLSEVADAIEHAKRGHARGKRILAIGESASSQA